MADESQVQAPQGQEEGGNAPEGEEPKAPDLSEQITALKQSFDSFAQAQQEPQQEAEPVGDIYSYLMGDESDQEDQDFSQEQFQQATEGTQPDQASTEAQFNELVRERVAEAAYPYLESIDREFRQHKLDRLIERHPDINKPEMVAKIRDRLTAVAQTYGDQSLASDPSLVEMAYMAERAAVAAQNEVSADEARNQGASLETGSGAPASEDEDPREVVIKGLLGASENRSVFG